MPETFDFAVSGINHAHIYGQVDAMLDAGCRLTSFHAVEDDLAATFGQRYPQATRVTDERAILEDARVRLVVGAGIPGDRAGVALRAMRAGKDAMVDKPGCTTEAELAELRAVQAETGRIFSICYSEHFLQPSTVAAARLVAEGAIGRVVSTVGLGPHRVGLHARPDWFWDTARGGSILTDIASHQFEQFLHFTDSTEARILSAVEQNVAHPEHPGWCDYGHATVASPHANGFVRVDWLTPAGLPGLGRRPPVPRRHRGNDRAAQVHRHRGPPRRQPPLPHRRPWHPSHRRLCGAPALRRPAPRRRRQPHRDRHVPGPLLSRHGARPRRPPARQRSRGVTRLKVGVVGAGIGASHIEGYAALPDLYEVAVLCDIDAARAAAVAGKHGVPATVTAFDDLLDRDLDIVDICTPPHLHVPQAVAALAAGRHVVLEKPVARGLAELDTLATAEAASARTVSPIFQYRFGHGIQKLHHLRARGFGASPSVATAETHWWRSTPYYEAARWRGTFSGELGGCLTSHAIHIHDLLCEVLGQPVSVHARTSNRQNHNETEDMAALSLEFDSGAFATSSVTLGSRQEMSRLRFCFSDLVAESGLAPYNPGHDPWTFPDDDPEAADRIAAALADFVPLPERFAGQFHRLHAALTGDAPLPVTLADARRSIELLTAAYWSAATGERVALPLPPDHPYYAGWIPAPEHAHG